MFLKLFGAIIIITSSSLIGLMLCWNLQRRLKDLRATRLALGILEKEISFLTNTLPQALNSASKVNSNISKIFEECADLLNQKKGYCIKEAWEMSVNNNFAYTYLKNEDKEILLSLGRNLGLYDAQNQTQNINYVSSQLDIQEKSVKDQIDKNSKMYKSLAFLGGLAISIILI